MLDSFVESDISQEFIDHINADFSTIRAARFSAIVRFMYTSDFVSMSKSFTFKMLSIVQQLVLGWPTV